VTEKTAMPRSTASAAAEIFIVDLTDYTARVWAVAYTLLNPGNVGLEQQEIDGVTLSRLEDSL
jgi:hypothetical protein